MDADMEHLYDKDDYKRMLVQTLADRLAEATAENYTKISARRHGDMHPMRISV